MLECFNYFKLRVLYFTICLPAPMVSVAPILYGKAVASVWVTDKAFATGPKPLKNQVEHSAVPALTRGLGAESKSYD
jgi:hypothetical protein